MIKYSTLTKDIFKNTTYKCLFFSVLSIFLIVSGLFYFGLYNRYNIYDVLLIYKDGSIIELRVERKKLNSSKNVFVLSDNEYDMKYIKISDLKEFKIISKR